MEVLLIQLAALEFEWLLAIFFAFQVFRTPAPLGRENPLRHFFFTNARNLSRRAYIASFNVPVLTDGFVTLLLG
jgi:hypothetical protein